MPLQVGDCLTLILDAQRARSAWDTFYNHLGSNGYFRPMFYAEVKMLFDVAGGAYAVTYRVFHALLLSIFLMLFVRALEVRDWIGLAAVPLALTVFVGLHTFLATVKELYPITHFLQVAMLALLALNLTQSKGGRVIDLALLVTFALAALTLESGLLVWVVVVAAWICGMPGVSRRAAVAITALLGIYVWVRFGVFGTGLPTSAERSTGFLLRALDAPEIQARFGDNLVPLYAYNVVSSLLSPLFSEPRSGIWVFVNALRDQNVMPRQLVNIAASLFGTGLIAAYVVDRIRSGVRWPATLADRHVVIFAAVLVANAAMSFVYTKDEIMSTAGAFYAFPVFGAAVHFLRRWYTRPPSWQLAVVLSMVFVAGSAAWATRAVGVHHVLRSQAFIQRNDWSRVERDWKQSSLWDQYATSRALFHRLRDEAIATRVANPFFASRWMERVFDGNY
jgi:hypothetical protein